MHPRGLHKVRLTAEKANKRENLRKSITVDKKPREKNVEEWAAWADQFGNGV